MSERINWLFILGLANASGRAEIGLIVVSLLVSVSALLHHKYTYLCGRIGQFGAQYVLARDSGQDKATAELQI